MNFSELKRYFNKTIALLVKHRMRSTRIIIALILFAIFFSKPGINVESFTALFFDWLGYFLIAIACLGRVFSAVFICGTKNEKISTEGPYSLVRNPLYVFSFLGIMGAGFMSGSIILLALLMLIFFIYYPEVVEHEETFLSEKFGDTYKTYQHKVPRWIPTHWNMHLPEKCTVYPNLLLKNLQDSSLFFLIYPIVEFVEYLHASDSIPILFTLY